MQGLTDRAYLLGTFERRNTLAQAREGDWSWERMRVCSAVMGARRRGENALFARRIS